MTENEVAEKARANGFILHHDMHRNRMDRQYRYWLENEHHQIVATGFLLEEMPHVIDLAVQQRERNEEMTRG